MQVTKRQLTSKQLLLISAGGLIISLVLHVLAVLKIYNSAIVLIITLTGGILFVWFEAGGQIKKFQKEGATSASWRTAAALCPAWLKYLTIFFIFYAVFNFTANVETQPSDGYLNFNISWARMKIISGFWMAFYMYGIAAGYVSLKREEEGYN